MFCFRLGVWAPILPYARGTTCDRGRREHPDPRSAPSAHRRGGHRARRARRPDRRAHRRAGRQPSGVAPRAGGAQRPAPRRVPPDERSAADRGRRPGAGRDGRVRGRGRRLQPAHPPRPRLAGRPSRDALRRRGPGDEQQPKPSRGRAGGPRPTTSVERRRRAPERRVVPHLRGRGDRIRARGRRHDRGGRGPSQRGRAGRGSVRVDAQAHVLDRRRVPPWPPSPRSSRRAPSGSSSS